MPIHIIGTNKNKVETLKMKHLTLCFAISLSFFASTLFAMQEGKFSPNTKSIEAILYGVSINIASYDGDAISYRTEIEGNKKLSIIEDNWIARFRNSHPVKGVINILVPKSMKIESLRLYMSSSDAKLEGLESVYFVISMCDGKVEINSSTFKCASFSIAHSSFALQAEITSTADFCFAETNANIDLVGKLSDYNFFYPYEEHSTLSIDGTLCKKDDRFAQDKKKKKKMGITQSISHTVLTFGSKTNTN